MSDANLTAPHDSDFCRFTEWTPEEGYACPCGTKATSEDLSCVVCGMTGHPDIFYDGGVACGRQGTR